MKIKKLVLILACFSALSCVGMAQNSGNNEPQRVVVEIKQQENKPFVVSDEKQTVEKAHEWVQFGSHVGGAMREGLSALTDEANKFAGTDAGRFTMLVIAWKVAGQDAMELLNKFRGIVIGVPILAIWTAIYVWVLRKRFISHRVVVKQTGFLGWGTKEYKVMNEEQLNGDEFGAVIVTTIIFLVVAAVVFFNAII